MRTTFLLLLSVLFLIGLVSCEKKEVAKPKITDYDIQYHVYGVGNGSFNVKYLDEKGDTVSRMHLRDEFKVTVNRKAGEKIYLWAQHNGNAVPSTFNNVSFSIRGTANSNANWKRSGLLFSSQNYALERKIEETLPFYWNDDWKN